MRQSNDPKWLTNGTIGLEFGFDLCAEHEFGIERIYSLLGCPTKKLGLKGRTVKSAENLKWIKKKTESGVEFEGFYVVDYSFEPHLMQVSFWGGKTLWCGWSKNSLGAFSNDPVEIQRLRALFDAAQRLDLAILGGRGIRAVVASSVPAIEKWVLIDKDKSKELLVKTANKSGILDRLKKANKKHFCCTPKWIDEEKREGLIFWLNPQYQQDDNCGWFTVQNLDDWIAGKGPIPKR